MSDDPHVTLEEWVAARDAMIDTVGTSPDAWFEELGIDPAAVLLMGQEIAEIASEYGSDTYRAAGTSWCMGFALGAVVMAERAKAATA